MKSIFIEKVNHEIKNDFSYSFETNEGIFLIEIIAKAKSWWQNLKGLKSFFKDDDITLNLNNAEIFTSNSKDSDVRAIWNGNELKGLTKTVLVVAKLKKGKHSLIFKPDKIPILESIRIIEIEEIDANKIIYIPIDNNPPEKGDRRPWISYVFLNLAVKELSILAKANKESGDDQDIKLIIDGKVEENEDKSSHKDWFWCGKVLKGNEKEFKKEINLKSGKHSIELWADKCPYLKKIEVIVSDTEDSSKGENNAVIIKPYTCGGVGCKENYNRYDEIIAEVVAYWNNEFLKDIDPPDEPLNPNLVKAMIYQESRMGFDETAGINIMQVGNEGDPSILTLRGESPEYWIHNGKLILLKYDAKVESTKDSVNWGVRWLYHKAQGSTKDKKRYWIPWRDAVIKYGPPEEEYIVSVWNIYKNGIKKEKNGAVRLWSIILLALIILFCGKGEAYSFDVKMNDQIIKEQNQEIDGIELSYSKDKKYFLAQIEQEKDWWEKFGVGRLVKENIHWLTIDKPLDGPFGEQAILSAKFVDLKEFGNPLVEIYGLTHIGHGFLYIYEIKDDELNLLFKSPAVDFNPDTRWAPGNYKKYGYGTCGEIFVGGKLASDYKDVNNDGISDIILSGTQEIICESEGDFAAIHEFKVATIPVKRIFLWDNNARVWSGGSAN
ncbi:MAG: hypothetical protein WCV83_01735 [Candidatus Magasanikbacteria bacterium]